MLLNGGRTSRAGIRSCCAAAACRTIGYPTANLRSSTIAMAGYLRDLYAKRLAAAQHLAGRVRAVDFLGPAALGAPPRAGDLAPAAPHQRDRGDERALDSFQVFPGVAGVRSVLVQH